MAIKQGNWSIWELMSKSDDELSKNEFELLDTIAALTLNVNKNLSAINEFYISNLSLQVPKAYTE